jgi:hypothetical protein
VLGEKAMGDEQREKALRLIKSGLHFCDMYNNLVKYNSELCGKCEHNGFRNMRIPPP